MKTKPIANVIPYLLFVLGAMMTLPAGAQNQSIRDSLKTILASGAPEREKAYALSGLIDWYKDKDVDSAYFYCELLMKKARTSGNDSLLIEGYRQLTRIYNSFEKYDTALIFCDSGINLAISSGNKKGQGELNISRGYAMYYREGPAAGLGPMKESYDILSTASDTLGMVKALNGIAVMYMKLAQNDSAITTLMNLVRLAEAKGYETQLGLGYCNLGILYQDLDNYDKAFYYLGLSIPINEKYRPDLVALARMNIGLIFYMQKEYNYALLEFRVALEQYSKIGHRMKNIADVLNNIGNVYKDINQFDSAYYYLTKAKDLYASIESWYFFGQVYHNMANVQLMQGHYNTALEMLDSSLFLAHRTGNHSLASLSYKSKYHIYVELKDYKDALANYLLHDSIEESIYTLDKEKIMADLEMKYQNEKKQAQLLVMEKENLEKDLKLERKTRQNYISWSAGFSIILAMFFGFLYYRQRIRKDRIIAMHRIHQLEEEQKLLAARSLVEGQEEERKRIARELHDGIGVLLSTTKIQFSTIHEVSPENQAIFDRATKLLDQASKDVRKISHNMMPGLLTKLGLYEAVGDLFDKLSETEGLNVTCEIPEDAERLPENKEIMLYRIIQELVNNTLKHSGAKNIMMKMEPGGELLKIRYSDDGKGFDVQEKINSNSLGLSTIQSRVSFLNGKMELKTEPGKGVFYRFEIPA